MPRWHISALPLPRAISPGLEQYAALLTPIRRRRRKAARHWRQTPFLYVSFDEHETTLTEVDVHGARSICTNCWKKVLSFKAMYNIIQFFAITSEEDATRARAVTNTYHVTLDVGGAVISRDEGLIVATVAGGSISYRGFMPT